MDFKWLLLLNSHGTEIGLWDSPCCHPPMLRCNLGASRVVVHHTWSSIATLPNGARQQLQQNTVKYIDHMVQEFPPTHSSLPLIRWKFVSDTFPTGHPKIYSPNFNKDLYVDNGDFQMDLETLGTWNSGGSTATGPPRKSAMKSWWAFWLSCLGPKTHWKKPPAPRVYY